MKTNAIKKKISLLAIVTTIFTCVACGQRTNETKNTAVQAPSTNIHTSVISGNVEAIKLHIAAKSDLNQKETMGGSTPLISAALFGQTEIAKLLIDAGANINTQNNEGSTALITAAFFCRPEIVKMLLEKKADKSIKNKYGSTAYETVQLPFEDAKSIYDVLGSALSPLGLKLDYEYIKKTRPVIAAMLK